MKRVFRWFLGASGLRRLRQTLQTRHASTRGLTSEAYLARPLPIAVQLRAIFSEDAELTIFDIGSCDALDAIKYARLFPRSTVYAFEPLPANVKLMRSNLRRFGGERVVVVPLALSDRVGTAEFFISSGHPENVRRTRDWCYGNKSSSLLAPNMKEMRQAWSWLRFDKKQQVSTTTMRAFMELENLERVDIIHIDVQGAELLVFLGAGDTLSKTRAIWTEVSKKEYYRGQALAGEIESLLASYGFENRMVEEDPCQPNILFVRTDQDRPADDSARVGSVA